MIVCLQTRRGIIHYINWKTHRSVYWTMCGKSYNGKKIKINTYGVDDALPNACAACQDYMEIDKEKRAARGDLLETNVFIYTDAIKKYTAPEREYGHLLDRRSWDLLRRLKSKRTK